MKKLKVIFCGTPEISVPTLEMLSQHKDIELSLVISQPDRPSGRGMELKSPEVVEFCKKNNIPYYQSENINKDPTLIQRVETIQPDFLIVFAFAQFLNDFWLNCSRIGCFNIHTSILPKYRGAAPIQYAILNGDSSTGVSIQKMVKKMDAGDICHFKEQVITTDDTGGSLYAKLMNLAPIALNELIEKISNNTLTFTPQNESTVSFAPTLKKEDGFLDFTSNSATKIINQVRALHPWPGTYFFLTNKRVKVLAVEKTPYKLNPGEIKNQMGSLVIGTLTDSLRISQLQLEGKKATTDKDLLLGWREELSLTQTKEQK